MVRRVQNHCKARSNAEMPLSSTAMAKKILVIAAPIFVCGNQGKV
jgi:hypothetical protein